MVFSIHKRGKKYVLGKSDFVYLYSDHSDSDSFTALTFENDSLVIHKDVLDCEVYTLGSEIEKLHGT